MLDRPIQPESQHIAGQCRSNNDVLMKDSGNDTMKCVMYAHRKKETEDKLDLDIRYRCAAGSSTNVPSTLELAREQHKVVSANGEPIFDILGKTKLISGYWQIELDAQSREKSAFTTNWGLYEFDVMPYGLCGTPSTFQRLMETVLARLQWDPCLVYLDDIIILSHTFDEHLVRLKKIQNEKEVVIAYSSRTLSKSERIFCTTIKELLAFVFFIKQYRHYLFGKKFQTRTDHKALKWLFSMKEPEGQTARWITQLSEYEFSIEHREGKRLRNADGMSRIPCHQCGNGENNIATSAFGMRRDLENYVANCVECVTRKNPSRTARVPLQPHYSGAPFEKIAIDILEMPMSDQGNRFIVVIGDYFSKWAEAFPLRNHTSPVIAEILIDQFISRFGAPFQLHSDQGPEFESRLISELCKLLGVDKTRTTT
ncbi:uncharacterized protein LOC134706010 [Mytilus trossulus]|uniref:uncharacterized protein LOC134706010 n=1 Tax=Mytilus trossulus TaxID=6551 RepID=UPI0030079DAC